MRCLGFTLLLLGSMTAQFAQQPPPASPAPAVETTPAFRPETNLVTVHFQYKQKKGSTLDLRPEDLELREDGAPQKISLLQGGRANPQTAPIEVNLLFDLRRAPEQVVPPWMRYARFDLAAIDDGQRVSVAMWTVGNGVRRLCGPTRDATQLNRAMDGVIQVWGNSAYNDTTLLEAIGAVIQQSAQGRRGVTRILVVLTDEEIFHQYGGPEAVSAAQENRVTIYPIIVGGLAELPYSAEGPGTYSAAKSIGASEGVGYKIGDEILKRRDAENVGNLAKRREASIRLNDGLSWLAKATNGQMWDINSVNLSALWDMILQRLAEQIRGDYVAGYYPSAAGVSKLREVQLSLKRGVSGEIAPKELYVRR